MVRFRLSREERRQKLREGRRGVGSTREMKRGEYIEWRNRQMEKKGKVNEEREKKRAKKEAEKRIKEMENTAKTGVTPPKWKARGKLLILVVVIAIIVYLVLKYSG